MRLVRRTTCLAVLAVLCCAFTGLADQESDSPLYEQALRAAERDGYRLVATAGLRELLLADPDILLVDVRFAYEYAAGHIPGAVSLPVDLTDRTDLSVERRQAFADVLGEEKGRVIVIYCRGFR
jgi:predicted sulfurtransferase